MQARTHSEGIGFDQSLGAFELDPLVLNTKVSSVSERIVLCNLTVKVVRIVAITMYLINRLSAPVVISRPVSRYMSTIIGDYDGSLVLVESASGDGDVIGLNKIWHRALQSSQIEYWS